MTWLPPRIVLALTALLPATAAAVSPLPVAPVRNVQETFFGTVVDDHYRYFEDAKAPEVAAWMKAHSNHAHATLRAIPGRDALRRRIEQLDASAPARIRDVARSADGRYFYQRRGARDDQFKLYVRQGVNGKERLLFDPERLSNASGKPHAINYFSPSPDGRLVALGVSAAGSEEAALRILEVATGRQVGPEIERAQFGAVSWAPDASEVFFHRMQKLDPGMPGTEKYQASSAVAAPTAATRLTPKPAARGAAPPELIAPAGLTRNGLPYNRLGDGPRTAVVFSGLNLTESKPLTGMEARFMLAFYEPLLPECAVYLLGRKKGLPDGYTMADMSDDYAAAIAYEFAGPVDVIGMSTGGSLALQFAGLLAERWYFFAEANHPQNLYYQAIA